MDFNGDTKGLADRCRQRLLKNGHRLFLTQLHKGLSLAHPFGGILWAGQHGDNRLGIAGDFFFGIEVEKPWPQAYVAPHHAFAGLFGESTDDGASAFLDFQLADYRGSTNFIVDTWRPLDLSSLNASALQISFLGSRESFFFGQWFSDTPLYVALDNVATVYGLIDFSRTGTEQFSHDCGGAVGGDGWTIGLDPLPKGVWHWLSAAIVGRRKGCFVARDFLMPSKACR